MKREQTRPGPPPETEGARLASWLGSWARGIPLLELLGPVGLEELGEGPGWALEFCGRRLRARLSDVTGRTRLLYESAYTLRLRLPVPEGLGETLPAPLAEFCERVDTAGQLTSPPPLGEGAFAALEEKIGKTPAEDGLWEYRLGLVARNEEICNA